MPTTTYSAKSAAVRAARKALGPEASPGLDFTVEGSGSRWTWAEKGAEASKPSADIPGLEEADSPEAATGTRMSAKHKAALAAAQAGHLPAPPDFSADTHKRFRPRLAEAVALAEAGDVAGLEAFSVNPISTSPKAIMRYRELALVALKAQAAA